MCDTCGCATAPHPGQGATTLRIEQPVLTRNDRLAERNRGCFRAHGLFVFNLLSSPGSGKTALIERTLADRHAQFPLGVIVGDLQTENDANRIRAHGAPAVQISTGTACHLDAHMVAHALEQLDLAHLRVLIIENVGNLVCPAAFDLGEAARVVLLSVTEGEDKPLKYPTIFSGADLVLITKMDLAEAVGFAHRTALENIRRVAPAARVLEVSSRTGQGMETWYGWLAEHLK